MRVWKDILSGDEMISDSYPHEIIHENAVLKVKSRLIAKKANEDFGISGKYHRTSLNCYLQSLINSYLWSVLANDEDGDGAAGGEDVSYVIDIVDHFGLKEIELKKAAWGAYIKRKFWRPHYC